MSILEKTSLQKDRCTQTIEFLLNCTKIVKIQTKNPKACYQLYVIRHKKPYMFSFFQCNGFKMFGKNIQPNYLSDNF